MVFAIPFPSGVSTPSPHTRFEIHADPHPHIFARIVDLFARHDILPARLLARRSCGGLWMDLDVAVDPALAGRLAERLRMTPGIAAVLLVAPPDVCG